MAQPSAALVEPKLLIEQALAARQHAYAPYSHYLVWAAVLADDGSIIVGCNVENAAYPATICAERVALTSATAQGKRHLVAIAVATQDGGSPCGICRQVMAELCSPNTPVYISDASGSYRTTTVGELLPNSFSGDSLA